MALLLKSWPMICGVDKACSSKVLSAKQLNSLMPPRAGFGGDDGSSTMVSINCISLDNC